MSDKFNDEEGATPHRRRSSSANELSVIDSDFHGSYTDLSVESLAGQAAKNARKTLAKSETKAVSYLRLVVLLVLLGTAFGLVAGVYVFARNVEEDAFRQEFEALATTTLRTFVEAFENQLSALDSTSQGITSYAMATGSTFPNVTVPDFVVKAATLRVQTGSTYSFWLPLVSDQDRAGYEEYSRNRQAQDVFPPFLQEEAFRMYQDAYFGLTEEDSAATEAAEIEAGEEKLEEEFEGTRRRLHVAGPDVHPTIHEQIWGFVNHSGSFAMPEGSGPFLPMRQMSPVIPMVKLLLDCNCLAF